MRRLAILLVLSGCGSVTPVATTPDYRADCRGFEAMVCDKFLTCTTGAVVADCLAEWHRVLNCETVTTEDGNLDACESQLTAWTCAVFNDTSRPYVLPDVCQNVFIAP